MDRAMLLDHLALAERHVVEGRRHVSSQRERIAQMERNGEDTTRSCELLATFLSMQEQHEEDLGRVRAELAKAMA
jgi:hypothetical protein